MLSMIISGPQSIKSTHLDIFLEPLLEELLDLWNVGIEIYNAFAYGGSQYFNLRAILIWTMHEFPTYYIVSGLVTKGYLGYPICGPRIKSRRSIALAKNVWDCMHRKYLSNGHIWQKKEFAQFFNGQAEHGLPPTWISVAEHVTYGRLREAFQYNRTTPKNEDPATRYGVNRVASLWRLFYWKVSSKCCTHFKVLLPVKQKSYLNPKFQFHFN